MNGLCGYLALDELELAEGAGLLSRMLDALAEPGGLGRGTAVGRDFGIGVRRLEAAAAHRRAPFRSPRGDFVLGLDGRPRLTKQGWARAGGESGSSWGASDDDDVSSTSPPGSGGGGGSSEGPHLEPALRALHSRDEEGLLEFLEGGFALALWDGRTRRMLLARDRFGDKPLFYAWARGGRLFLFASEAKAILRTGRVDVRFDGRGVLDVLSAGHLGATRTLFAGVEQLAPGTWLGLDVLGTERRARWYEPPYPRRGSPRRSEPSSSLAPILRQTLSHLIPARVVCPLDGGPASGLLAALLAEIGEGLGTAGAHFDEPVVGDDRARVVDDWAARLGSDHAAIRLGPLSGEDAEAVLRTLEVPPLEPGRYFEAQLYAALAAGRRRVVVAADGAAELFAGGELGVTRPSPAARFARGWWARLSLRSTPGLARALRRGWASERQLLRLWGAAPVELERWALTAHLSDRLFHRRYPPPPGLDRWCSDLGTWPRLIAGPVHRRLRLHQGLVLAGRELWYGDRFARAVGIDRRLPYLHRSVVEHAATVGLGSDLAALRAALPPGLGGRARRRRARPLRPPNPIWPFGPGLPGWVVEALSPRALVDVGLFAPTPVGEVLERLSVPVRGAGDRAWARVLLGVLGLQVIARSFGVSDVVWPSPRAPRPPS